MRICVFVDGLSSGGAERQAIVIAGQLAKSGCEVDLVRYHEINQYSEFLQSQGINDVRVSSTGDSPLTRFRKIYKHFRAKRYDVVHCLKDNAGVWGVPAAWLARVPHIFSGCRHTPALRERFAAHRMVNKMCKGWIVNAESIKVDLVPRLGIKDSRVHVIPNAVLPETYESNLSRQQARERLGLNDDQIAIGMIAMLRASKNHPIFFSVMRRIRKNHPNAIAYVVGDGPEQEKLEEAGKDLVNQGGLRFLGRRNDINDILRGMDIVAHTSESEGMPNSLMEAGAAGRPIVATDIGDTGEVVRDGETGYVVPVGDADLFFDRLQKLCAEPALREQYGDASRDWVTSNYSVEALGKRYLQLYQSACGLKPSGDQQETNAQQS